MLHYVSGYLYSKCLKQHECNLCIEYGRSQKNLNKSFLLCHFKAYSNYNNDVYGNLQMPDTNFYEYIFELESIFIQRFPILAINKGVANNIKAHLDNVPFTHPYPKFDYEYLIKLFIRFRIFSTTTFLNRELVSIKQLKHRKLSILKDL